MNTGGPAFPVPDTYHPNGQVQFGSNGMTLLDWYAGQETLSDFDHPEENMPVSGAVTLAGPQPEGGKGWEAHFLWNAEWRAKMKYIRASAMLSEKARREATDKDSLTVQTREVDDDRWAKFQDGFRISFQPTIGWCAEIRDGSMGYGNTIAEAIANLRARWEERSAAPVVQESSTTADAAKMADLQEANRELVEFIERLASFPLEEFGWQDRKDSQPIHGWNDYTLYVSDIKRARNLVAKHKGAA